jgi:RNA polymerase sigma-70 factor (ECF subfamily)
MTDDVQPLPTDDWLLARARRGDGVAFGRLAERHAARLYGAALALTGSPADAEDLVQETLAGAYRGLEAFEGRSSVRTWLTAILLRRAAMLRRGTGRREAHVGPLTPVAEAEAQSRSSGMAAADARMDVAAALATLSDEHREVVVLRELEGLTYDEIAAVLGLPRGTVESRLFRARRALEERLSGYME